ncbi:MAG: ATP-binding protein [Bdellovibrio sp.]
MTLRTRIFSFNLISVLIATFVVAIIGLKIVESTVIDSTYQRLAQTRLNKTNLIETYFGNLKLCMGLISQHGQTPFVLKDKSLKAYPDLRNLFDRYAVEFEIYDIILVDTNGTIVYSTKKEIKDGVSIHSSASANKKLNDIFNWFFKASKNTTLFYDFSKDTLNPSVSTGFYAAPIFQDNNLVGGLILKTSMSQIDRITSHNFSWSSDGMGETGETLVYGRDLHLRNSTRFQPENIPVQKLSDEDVKKIEKKNELRELGFDYRNEKVIRNVGKIYLPNGDYWYVETKIDNNEAFAVLDRIAVASAVAGVLIFIFFFFITFAATGKVLEPLQLLTDRLEKLGTSNLTQKIKYYSKDEVGLLVDKYNQVAHRLESTTVSKEFLDSVIQSINALLFIVKVEHKNDWSKCCYLITQANETARKYLGLTQHQLRQTDLKDIIRAVPDFKNYHWLLQNRQGIEAEIVTTTDEAIPVLVNWAVLPNHQGEDLTFVFVCTDIKERITAENALIEAREQAESASVAKSEFLARMSHEIRTPLNAIIGVNDVLVESDLKPEQEQMVKVCKHAGENLLALVNDILDMAKIEAGEVQLERMAFDLETATKNLCEIFKFKAKEKNINFKLDIQIEPENKIILTDPARLRQVLLNLIGNAIKFTDKGQILVSVTFDSSEKLVRFLIKDTGVGIPFDKQALVFQSFAQADSSITRKFGGSGLGLAISKNLVELMGGRIWFNSEPGIGSEFYFTIPFEQTEISKEIPQEEHHKQEEIQPQNTQELQLHKPKILIVDDTEDNRFLLLTYLKKLPYEVFEASNGQEAIDKVFNDKIDLVLMDIQMPVMDGYEATKRIREWEVINNKKPIPIIAVSANAMTEDIQKSLDAGCTEHLTKPIKKSFLLEIISRHT